MSKYVCKGKHTGGKRPEMIRIENVSIPGVGCVAISDSGYEPYLTPATLDAMQRGGVTHISVGGYMHEVAEASQILRNTRFGVECRLAGDEHRVVTVANNVERIQSTHPDEATAVADAEAMALAEWRIARRRTKALHNRPS
jgi:hypothetical protein